MLMLMQRRKGQRVGKPYTLPPANDIAIPLRSYNYRTRLTPTTSLLTARVFFAEGANRTHPEHRGPGVITACGVRRVPDPGSVLRYHQMEIRSGYFERRVILHTPLDPRGAHWDYEDGFLFIYIPKAVEQVRHVFSMGISF